MKKKKFTGTDKIKVNGVEVGADHTKIENKDAGVIVAGFSIDIRNPVGPKKKSRKGLKK